MRQKYFFLFLLLGLKMYSQTDTFIASTCIGTTTGPQARFYTPLVADFDNDSDKDVIVLDEGGVYRFFTNNGLNNFTQAPILSGLAWSSLLSKDLDNDGDVDIVSTTGKIFINNGAAVFSELTGPFFTATGSISNVKIADFNNDGKQDLLWLNGNMNSSSNNQLWLNNGTTGNASFALFSQFDNMGIYANGGTVVGNVDNDTDTDLILCGQGGWNGKILKNDGLGNFTLSQNLTTYTGNGFIADWDKDGDNDFLAYDYYNNWGLRLWKNDGSGNFGTPSATPLISPLGNANDRVFDLIDLNGDTWLDVVYTSGNGARYFINSGCQLTLKTQVLTSSWNGAVITDFTNDGKPDIFCAARDAQSCIHINDLNVQSYVAITQPVATTQISYFLGQTASPLSATGNVLLWYTSATGGTGSSTAPTPSTASVGTTSYWVSNTNTNGCESERKEIVVTVSLPATHLNFDGVNDYVDCGTTLNTVLDPLNTITVEAWVNPTINTGLGVIIGNYANSNQSSMQFVLRRDSNNYAFWVSGNPGVFKVVMATNAVVLNTWQHVAGVWNGSDLKIYVNGNLMATTTGVTESSFATSTNSMFIGNNQAGTGAEKFKGSIDEVRIWNFAKTIEQINGSKNCELPGSQSGLLAYYKFNQGIDQSTNTGVTTLDATAGPNGILTNFTLSGSTSNWLAGSPVTTGSIVPSVATVTTPVVYNQGATASVLTATTGTNGTGLMWYTVATGGTGSTTAPTPSTATAGNTSYWVASTNANGCESERTEIIVTVNAVATHLNFDGTNDNVTLPASAINNLPQGTIEAWIYPTATVLDNQTICAKQSNFENSYAIFTLGGGNAANGKLHYQSKNGAYIVSNATLTANQWTHVAVTFTNTQAKIYINGTLDATASGDFSLPNDISVTATSIGAWLGDGNGQYFKGNIDEFRVWNAALTPTDLSNTMNCELDPSQTNIVTYYKFNQGFDNASNASVTSLTDMIGSNHGTLANFALTGPTSNWQAGSTITTGNICTVLSSNDFVIDNNVKLYPNPTSSVLNLEIVDLSNVNVELIDLNGRILMKQALSNTSNTIDLSGYNAAIYILKVTSNEGTSSYKIVKQ